MRLRSPEVSVRKGPRQLTHNRRLKLVAVVLRSAYLHLHKGARDAAAGLGKVTGPQHLGPQEPSVRILPARTPWAKLESATWVGSHVLITGEVLHPPGADTPTTSLLWTRKIVSKQEKTETLNRDNAMSRSCVSFKTLPPLKVAIAGISPLLSKEQRAV